MADIVERLRGKHRERTVTLPDILHEAADEIERLRALSANNAHSWDAIVRERDASRAALEDIALLDEADGHELTEDHALRAVAIATTALGKHPSQIQRGQP